MAQSPEARRDAVARALAGDDDFENVEVSLDEEGRVLLSGTVPILWVKLQAIERALKAAGGEDVVSELVVPVAESDENLAEAVVKVIQGYEYYTLFDYISGAINNGVVTLVGKVTPIPDKPAQLTERIAKVRGVQDIQNRIEVMTPSRADDELRARLARAIFSHPSFQRFGSMVNPPIHVVVDNSIVTLIGYVQTQTEYIEIQQIASQVQGILRIDNQLQTLK